MFPVLAVMSFLSFLDFELAPEGEACPPAFFPRAIYFSTPGLPRSSRIVNRLNLSAVYPLPFEPPAIDLIAFFRPFLPEV